MLALLLRMATLPSAQSHTDDVVNNPNDIEDIFDLHKSQDAKSHENNTWERKFIVASRSSLETMNSSKRIQRQRCCRKGAPVTRWATTSSCRAMAILVAASFSSCGSFFLQTKKQHTRTSFKPVDKVELQTIQQLNDHWDDVQGNYRRKNGSIDYTQMIKAASVKGDTQMIGKKNYTHPVLSLLHDRRRNGKNDQCKVALSIEGGGMRGCISAGMVSAVHYLNLTDSFDVMYGSSAGAVVGSYLLTGQIQWFGPEVYYDQLTTAGREFINTRRLLRALGLGLLDPRLLRDVVTRRRDGGKPVVNLPYLLKRTVQEKKPLDWEKFAARQKDIPLTIMASGLRSEKAIPLSMVNGGFSSLEELTDCMHASCLLPGIAGPVMNIDKRILYGKPVPDGEAKMLLGNNLLSSDKYEPLADSLLYEALPFKTAFSQDNVTHCVVIRSVPDGVDVSGKGSLFQTMIMKRFFSRKNKLHNQYERMRKHLHKRAYSEDVLFLNQHAVSDRDPKDTSSPQLMTIALPPGSPEIGRLEVSREAIFEGIRRGFARAYDCLVEDPNERGRGMEVAKEFFPDDILQYDPRDFPVSDRSAYTAYQESKQKEALLTK